MQKIVTEDTPGTSKICLENYPAADIPDIMATTSNENSSEGRSSKYPYYPIASALRLAEAIKVCGGARTPVKKSLIAKQVGVADNAAAFSQGLTSAKIFGLVEGHGEYTLSEIAKRYFFPTTETDKSLALLDAFSSPGSFKELLKRFDGDKLPPRAILANILHRELGVPDSWNDRVAGLFSGAAQEIGVLDGQGILRFDAARHAGAQTPARDDPPPPGEQGGKSKLPDKPSGRGKPDGVTPEMVVWTLPYAGTRIEVWTPPELDMAHWLKLEGYVKLLKPDTATP